MYVAGLSEAVLVFFQADSDVPYQILGCDIAGTIVEVGADVTHVKVGDHVAGMTAGDVEPTADGSFEFVIPAGAGGFQLFSVATAQYLIKLPEHISFEEGSVLPLGTLTAASALYLPQFLGLTWPSMDVKGREEYLLVWGGASSVGSCGIQLAINSGYRVVTTCSAANAAYCGDLGAEQIFDYKNDAVVEEIVGFLKIKKIAGIFDSISKNDTIEKCVELARKLEGSPKVLVVQPFADKGHPPEVRITAVMEHLKQANALKIFASFLPEALQNGKFKAKPDPLIVGHGLEHAQKGCDTSKAGVSARKAVITL